MVPTDTDKDRQEFVRGFIAKQCDCCARIFYLCNVCVRVSVVEYALQEGAADGGSIKRMSRWHDGFGNQIRGSVQGCVASKIMCAHAMLCEASDRDTSVHHHPTPILRDSIAGDVNPRACPKGSMHAK